MFFAEGTPYQLIVKVLAKKIRFRNKLLYKLFLYSYNNKSKELISIPTLPGNGRMGFGLAATDDDKIIGVGGHNFDYESMSNVTMLDTQAEKFEWQNLPDMTSKVLYSRKEISQ